MFAYCLNNPINKVDFFGNIPIGLRDSQRYNYIVNTMEDGPQYEYPEFSEPLKVKGYLEYYESYCESDFSWFDYNDNGLELFSVSTSLVSSGAEGHFTDINAVNFCSVEVYAHLWMDEVAVGAMVAVYSPSVTFHFGAVDLTFETYLGGWGR